MADHIRPTYPKLREWARNYGRPDVSDQRGVQDFIDCETTETIKSLQSELVSLAEGNFDEKLMDDILGARRRIKYTNYTDWARLMLQWIAGYKG